MKNKETLEEAAEKLYSEDIMWGMDLNKDTKNAFIQGAKWQAERMYSEEDMRKVIFTSFLLGVDRGNYSKKLENKLIEKFKQ